MRLLGKLDHLGFVLGCFGESAELGQAHDQPRAVVDRGGTAIPKYSSTQWAGNAARLSAASSLTRL
jgi:hypothetical protein